MSETCAGCRFWAKDHPAMPFSDGTDQARLTVAFGCCRRRAPVVAPDNRHQWPVTEAGSWCGEFEPAVVSLQEEAAGRRLDCWGQSMPADEAAFRSRFWRIFDSLGGRGRDDLIAKIVRELKKGTDYRLADVTMRDLGDAGILGQDARLVMDAILDTIRQTRRETAHA